MHGLWYTRCILHTHPIEFGAGKFRGKRERCRNWQVAGGARKKTRILNDAERREQCTPVRIAANPGRCHKERKCNDMEDVHENDSIERQIGRL